MGVNRRGGVGGAGKGGGASCLLAGGSADMRGCKGRRNGGGMGRMGREVDGTAAWWELTGEIAEESEFYMIEK